VAAVDPQARRVTLEGGETLDYGALILATGATPIPLTVPGAELPHVFTLRTLADSRAIIARAQGAKQAVVVGAGFIALEVAAALRTRGVAVHVVAPDARPLGKVLGPEVGDFLRALHEEHGVVFHFGQAPSAIDPQGVTLTSGERLAADLVVAGIGVRPEVALARQAGLEVDNGVLVDTFLQTSQPGIYAVGDIARYPDARSGQRLRIEHWAVAGRQGKTAARNVLGRREPFDAVPFFWSAHYDVVLAYVGHGVGWERAEVSGSLAGRSATITYRREGKVVAVATLFRDRESLEIEAAMEAGDPARVEALVAG
jgi:3-phenylpropionate/trans-cinnamate dioxygenase ferredoxin reductase subunit